MDRAWEIERLETRIENLKQDSRMCSYRIDFHTDKRAGIQKEIRKTKSLIKRLQKRGASRRRKQKDR